VQFIGVISKSTSKSVIAYYGIENHSKWLFTPMFRGTGTSSLPTTKSSGSSATPPPVQEPIDQ
jgi:hypothetical protein